MPAAGSRSANLETRDRLEDSVPARQALHLTGAWINDTQAKTDFKLPLTGRSDGKGGGLLSLCARGTRACDAAAAPIQRAKWASNCREVPASPADSTVRREGRGFSMKPLLSISQYRGQPMGHER